jgi:MFS family permease
MKNGPQDVGALPDGIDDSTGTSFEENKIKAPELKGLTFAQALKSRNYWYIMPTWLFAGVATMLIYTHVIPFAVDMNISSMSASTILTIIGAVAIPSGILAGRLIDTTGPKKPLLVFTLLYAGAIASFIWASELWNLYLSAAIIGVCNAGLGITIVAVTVDAFGKRRMGMILASLDACHSIGAVIGPLIGGLVFDTYGSYNLAFLIASTGLVIASLMLAFFKTKTAERVYG